MKLEWRQVKFWAAVFYILVAAAVVLSAAPWFLQDGIRCNSVVTCVSSVRGILLIAALVALFVLVFLFFIRGWTWEQDDASVPADPTGKVYFPHGATRPVIWIIFFWLVASLSGLFIIFWDPWQLASRSDDSRVYEMFLAIFSAGAGSSVATIMAYLVHASRRGDFSYAYVPWYMLRPLLGGLLGLIFYFLMRGGLIAILESPPSNDNFDDLALAGVSALVGLFSNEAYMKLQEVFNTIFKIQPAGGNPGGQGDAGAGGH